MQKQKSLSKTKNKTYVVYMKDATQDKQFRRLNLTTGAYVRQGEKAPQYKDADIPMLRAYMSRIAAINRELHFQIRDTVGTVVWQT